MKKEDLVKYFFNKGSLLSPDLLEYMSSFSDNEINSIVERKIDDIVITKSHVVDIKRYDVIKSLYEKTPPNQLNYLNSKFLGLMNIITGRIDKKFISINKILPSREDIYIVGMVKDIKEGEKTLVEIEDQTGSVVVSFDEPIKCDLDDVVVVQAIPSGKIIYGKKIIYPDVPLREPVKGSGRGCFISDLHLNEAPDEDINKFFQWLMQENINYLFVAGDVVDIERLEKFCGNNLVFLIPGEHDTKNDYPQTPLKTTKDNIISLSNPSMVNVGGINILMIHNFDLSMIKKRHLGDADIGEDYLVLDSIPDIVHCGHDHKPFVSNYKSITVVNSGSLLTEFKPVVVDFSSRDWKQVTL